MILKAPVASSVPVDDSSLPEIAPVDDVQEALEKLHDLAAGTSKGYVFAYYNGNAITGRFLELFGGIDTDDAPLFTPDALDVITIVSATTQVDATCTIEWIDGVTDTLLHTTTFVDDKRVVESGGTLFTLPASGELKIKIGSGSIQKPHIYFVAKGG
jgi:hypothetical protein